MRLDHVRDYKRAVEKKRFGDLNPFAHLTEDQRRSQAMSARQDNTVALACDFCGRAISGLGARCKNDGPAWPHPVGARGRA